MPPSVHGLFVGHEDERQMARAADCRDVGFLLEALLLADQFNREVVEEQRACVMRVLLLRAEEQPNRVLVRRNLVGKLQKLPIVPSLGGCKHG